VSRTLSRRFPPQWSVEDIGAAFVVKDSNRQQLAYVYFEEEPQRRVTAKMLTKDEGRTAANIAALLQLRRILGLEHRANRATGQID
jgi:hypothetical protein